MSVAKPRRRHREFCDLCGRDGAQGFIPADVDGEPGYICANRTACERRQQEAREDPLLSLMGLMVSGMIVADIVTHPETTAAMTEQIGGVLGGFLLAAAGGEDK